MTSTPFDVLIPRIYIPYTYTLYRFDTCFSLESPPAVCLRYGRIRVRLECKNITKPTTRLYFYLLFILLFHSLSMSCFFRLPSFVICYLPKIHVYRRWIRWSSGIKSYHTRRTRIYDWRTSSWSMLWSIKVPSFVTALSHSRCYGITCLSLADYTGAKTTQQQVKTCIRYRISTKHHKIYFLTTSVL